MSFLRLRVRPLVACLAALACLGPLTSARADAAVDNAVDPPVEPAEILAVFPHDPQAFTEGLFYEGGFLYESTGLIGHSVIRKVDLRTGKVLAQESLPEGYFGEGITSWQNRLVSLTWRGGVGFIWSFPGIVMQGRFEYPGEGWGLTHDAHSLIMSDGSACLKHLDPITFHILSRLCVTASGIPVKRLNELEYIHGEIWANIWMTPEIARIDPVTGKVKSWVDLSVLAEKINSLDPDAVANGIAYDRENDRLFVTGKYWQNLYQIRIMDHKK